MTSAISKARLMSSIMIMRFDLTGSVMLICEFGPDRPQRSSLYMGECSECIFSSESRNQCPSSLICALSRKSRCCLAQKISTAGTPACQIFSSQNVVNRWLTNIWVDKTCCIQLLVSFRFRVPAAIRAALQPALIIEDRLDARHYGISRPIGRDLVSHSAQDGDGIGRDALLQIQLVGHPLVMKAGPVDRVLHVHVKVHHVQDDLQNAVDDTRSTRRAQDQERLAVAHQ